MKGILYVARDSSEKYLVTNDSDLTKIYNSINNSINNSIKQIEIEKIESELVAEVNNIPASEYRKNLNLYKELLLLNPGNNEYQEKVQFYEQQLKDEKLATKRQEKIESQFHPWDGSHINLERYTKSIMNDPDSFEHVKTYYQDKGSYLIVSMSFRG